MIRRTGFVVRVDGWEERHGLEARVGSGARRGEMIEISTVCTLGTLVGICNKLIYSLHLVPFDYLGCDFFSRYTDTQIRERTVRNILFRMVSFVFSLFFL